MCGIAGLFRIDGEGAGGAPDAALLDRMTDALVHRGPDGRGVRLGPGYGLGHRRLSIVDLAGGAQPMDDGSGEVWVTFNGEIYNHESLRSELEGLGCRFRTRCDTEVLVHGWRLWGERLPERLRGMFALAIVDESAGQLFLARDRLGKKPLHLHRDGTWLRFASEPKALFADPAVPRRLDPQGVAEFFCLRYAGEERTGLAGITRLPPAGACTVARDGTTRMWRYWGLAAAAAAHGNSTGVEAGSGDPGAALWARLGECATARTMADVPWAPFLSGGLDSQAVVAALCEADGPRPGFGCTVGFTDPEFDERDAAHRAAKDFGIEVREAVLDQDDIADLSWLDGVFDEPFGDSSAIPTWHVCRLARREVVVALSGDGGDEALGGYTRYFQHQRDRALAGKLPAALWRGLGGLYPSLHRAPRAFRWKRSLQDLGLDAAVAYARGVSACLPAEVAPVLKGAYRDAAAGGLDPVIQAYRRSPWDRPIPSAMFADYHTWLPCDILTKVDRTSMAVSLEVRAPMLDQDFVGWCAALPDAVRLRGGETKPLLRKVLGGKIPAANRALPKKGFSVPLKAWLRGPLGDDLAHRLEHQEALLEVVDRGQVMARLQEHRAGGGNHRDLLWHTLVLGRLLDRWEVQP